MKPEQQPAWYQKALLWKHGEELIARLPAGVPLVGAEVGVWKGPTAEKLLRGLPQLTLYMVDCWYCTVPSLALKDPEWEQEQQHQRRHKAEAERRTEFAADRRRILHMDSLHAAAQIKDGALDFVFIDADHSYEGCAADIEVWRSKVRPGGLLSGHDYDHPVYPEVRQAVDEAVSRHRWTLEVGDHFTWFVTLPGLEITTEADKAVTGVMP